MTEAREGTILKGVQVRRNLLKGAAAVAAAGGVAFGVRENAKAVREALRDDVIGQPREDTYYQVSIVPFKEHGRMFEPVVRKDPRVPMDDDANKLSDEELRQLQLDYKKFDKGRPVWGGAYNGLKGSFRNEKNGIEYGKWLEVEANGKKYYIADTFVNYDRKLDDQK